MEGRVNYAQTPGVFNRLFNFLADTLLLRGFRRVTLGRPMENCSFQSRTQGIPAAESRASVTKSTEESTMHNLAFGVPRPGESLVERASKLNNSFPITSIGSPVDVLKEGDEDLHEEFMEFQLPPVRMIPVGGSQKEITPSNGNGEDDGRVPFKEAKIHELGGQEVVVPLRAVHQGITLKKKGKSVLVKGKGKLALPMVEPGKDVKVRPKTPLIPLISNAFNIDERSDELIRRTREALRNSSRMP